MRFLLLLILFTFTLFAKETTITVGAGIYTQTQPYKDNDTLILPSPVIFFDNSLLYIRWTRVGLYFAGDKSDELSWGCSLTVQPRANSYKSNSTYMEDKDSTWEGGLAFGISKENYYAELLLLHDILNKYDSFVAQLDFGSEYSFKDITFYPSISFFYQSSEFINYYYEPADPHAGIDIAIQTYINYPLTKSLSAFINLKAEKLSKEITSSAIVEDKMLYSSLFSLIYTFHLK